MISEQKVQEALDIIDNNAALVGQLRGRKSYLEHRIKVERSQAFLDASGTVGERDSTAWVNESVQQAVQDLRDCITELDTLTTKMKWADLAIDVWRTVQANNRRGNI